MRGNINKIETLGALDGPGVRIVIFMQGCSLRCLYCHNPETWELNEVKYYSPEEIIKLILKYKSYFGENGGVTFSGGEPLMQPQFLIECLKLCKKNNIHTCLDTAGVGVEKYYEEILKYTDLVLYDVKAVNYEQYKFITRGNMENTDKFFNLCQKLNKNLWIRSVIVPDINDSEEYIEELAAFLKNLKNIKKVELLPYETIGVHKYTELNIEYPLEDTKSMDKNKCKILEEKLNKLLGVLN